MLPAGSVDIVFFCSVYKEIDGRIEYMQKVRQALKRGGRVAIIEFKKEREVAGPEFRDRMSDEQVTAELIEAGFYLKERFDFLPREYFLVFGVAGEEGYSRDPIPNSYPKPIYYEGSVKHPVRKWSSADLSASGG